MEDTVAEKKVDIEIDGLKMSAVLYGGKSVEAFARALPLEARLSRWGDEYYGGIGIQLPEDSGARDLMEVGELAYWEPGRAFCIFFGPTPASTDSRPRAASEVIPLGKIEGETSALKSLGGSVMVRLSLA
jgi:hypothetical protein